MLKICVYTCLLSSALSVVEMKKPLNINGRVGESETFKCSDWDAWTDLTTNDKYFCDSPCTDDKHIIVRAAYGETKQNNRIKITNRADGLSVTFTNLQKSDSKTYYCGVDRALSADPYIKVNLKVTDASPKTTPKTAVVGSTLLFAVTNSPSSSSSDIITDKSTSYTTLNTTTPTASANQRAGSVPYLIIGVVVILTMLMVLLNIVSMMRRKQQKVVPNADTTQEDAQRDMEYEDIRPEDQTDPDCLYANYSYHQDTESAAHCSYTNDVSLNSDSRFEVNSRGPCAESRVTCSITYSPGCDLIYSVAQLPKEQNEPTVQSELNQSESYKNDFLYSLGQLPKAT